jgi:hypothetical protein
MLELITLSSDTPDGVALIGAFLSGIAIMVFGYAALRAIFGAVKVLITPAPTMAKRNK